MNKLVIVIPVVIFVVGIIILTSGKNKNANVAPNQPTKQTTAPTEESQQQRETQQSTQEETVVTLTSSGFEPQTITVKTGTKVVWTNESGDAATVNSDLHPIHRIYPPLNLGEFANKESLSLIFDKPGTYSYHDHLNPSRTGTVVVE